MLQVLIMAGGGGTRFWPRSRQKKPKQFLRLTGDQSLLQQTYERIEPLAPPEACWIITAVGHVEETLRQVPALPRDHVIGEPCGRDTAACIGLGASLVAAADPQATLLVVPADHAIEPAQEFRRAAQVAAHLAEEVPEALVTFGIRPTFAATGYGYLQRGAPLTVRQGLPVYRVQAFREKPDVELAEQFLAAGGFYWNSGMFVWRAATILEALRQHQPTLHAAIDRIAAAWPTPRRADVFAAEYQALPKISIDYAVMEKAKDVLVVEAPFRWDDVGSWLALERHHPQDADGNTIHARHGGLATKGCVIVGDPDILIATLGVDNLLIVQDGDAILVADRREEGNIKNLVEVLKKRGLDEYL
ncbi:MAG: sugar phosphate nucleotidyltransferase [Gemmataceae bacterium]|nr:sugar phosphate nucleotidyltransferase [Gemmataceae bacterium]